MADEHPNPDTLRRFMLGELRRAESRHVVAHLVKDCAVCRAVTAEVLRPHDGHDGKGVAARPGSWRSASEQFSLERALKRAFAKVHEASAWVAEERRQAAGQVAKLLRRSLSQQLLLVRNSAVFSSLSLCDRLVAESWERRLDDPRRSCELAQLAVEVADRVDPDRYGAALVEDLRARAWVGLANAHRVLSDFAGAETALRRAAAHLSRGTGNPVERAGMLDIEASLRSSQHRDEEAEGLLNRAIAIYRRAGDRHALGRALIKKGLVRGYLDDPETEIVLVREGLALIDAEAEPRLVVIAWHNLILALHHQGHSREALALLGRARPLYLRIGDRNVLVRFQWLEGTLAQALGRAEQAEGCFREVRRVYIDQGLAIETALVSLELAGLLVDQGRRREVMELAAETVPILRSRRVQGAALAAMVLFQQAAEREQLTADLLRRVAETLRKEQPARPAAPPGA
jgi:tetratricopeptide (TPR) repeat protein